MKTKEYLISGVGYTATFETATKRIEMQKIFKKYWKTLLSYQKNNHMEKALWIALKKHFDFELELH